MLDRKKWVYNQADSSNYVEIVKFPGRNNTLHIVGKNTNSEVFTRIYPGGGAPYKLTFSFYQPSGENKGYAGVVHQPGCTPMHSFWWLEWKPPIINLWTNYQGVWAPRWTTDGIECDRWYKVELIDKGNYLTVGIYKGEELIAQSGEIPHDPGFSGFGGPISFGAHTGGGLQGVFFDDIVIEWTSPPPAYSLPKDYKQKAPFFSLKNQTLRVDISKDRGWILRVRKSDGTPFFDEGMGCILVENVSSGKRYGDSDFSVLSPPLRITKNEIKMNIASTDRTIELETKCSLAGDSFIWEAKIKPKYETPQEGRISFLFPLPSWLEEIFLPMFGAPFKKGEIPRYCVYRGGGNLSIPMVTFYSLSKDTGLTVLADPNAPKPSFDFAFNPEGSPPTFQARWNNLRMQKGRQILLRLYIAVHRGDWRSGLRWVLYKFPEYFKPEMKVAPGHQVITWEIPEERLKWLTELGFTWGDSHLLTTPYYGKYISEVNTSEEIAQKNAFLKLCHKHNFQFYYYWSFIETEPSFAESNFPESIARWPDGRPMLLGWGGFPWMVPYPGGKWRSYILDQLERLLKALPEVDGIFVDNTGASFISYGQDDGYTFTNNLPAYQYAFAQHSMLREVKEKLKKLGKGMWANGACDLESARYMDGIMVESRSDFLEAQQHLGLVKPMLFITYYDKKDPERKEKLVNNLKSALLCGAMLGFNEWELVPETIDLELLKRWLPLFEPLRGRQWVLEAYCLSLPAGVKGNIFLTSAGDYFIPLVKEQREVEKKFFVEVDVPDG
ncbi:hypothetical protein H5T87_08750, partial [bacterium]|nr:hypothetical protein [bacterium]